jgi:hypothetical protein
VRIGSERRLFSAMLAETDRTDLAKWLASRRRVHETASPATASSSNVEGLTR